MSTPGFVRTRLEGMHQVLSGYVERHEMPGLVALVSHHDEVQVETIGAMDFNDSAPMERDTIFRIASITKLMTAVAAMMLVEECQLRLDEPIDPWLPELAKRRVLKSLAAEPDDTVAAARPITTRDLLTSRMGFGSVMARADTYPIQKLIREKRIGGDGPKSQAGWPPTDEWVRNLGSLPWLAQPGEQWLYHVSLDLLGVLIARVAGQSFGAFMRERIFDPLGMKDTGFQVTSESAHRLPSLYYFNRQTNKLDHFEDPANSTWLSEPPFESGGGGLVSTIDDCLAFSRMMLDQGRYGREQLLSRATVELMTTDHLTPEQRLGAGIFLGTHCTWGFGMSVDIRREEISHSPGRFGWAGGFGTSAYIDPANRMIGILFTQRMIDSPESTKLFSDFWTAAYAAME